MVYRNTTRTRRRSFRRQVAGGLGALGFVALLGACAATQVPGAGANRYVITVPRAQFYKEGPAQPFGADATLTQGQRLTVVSRDFGYSRVTLESGQSGYVATEDMKPAPPDPVTPAPRPTPKPGLANVGRRANSAVEPVPAPLFDVTDVPAPPLPKGSEPPSPAPVFRY